MQSLAEVHEVLHAVAPQRYGLHACVAEAGQLPVPLHEADAVCVPLLQDAARHAVAPPGYAHAAAFVPSQLPAQAEPSLVHAVRVPTGAPLTIVQVPGVTPPAFTLHAWHCPAQAALQQTPSTQMPLPHSTAPPQVVPSVFKKPATTVCGAWTLEIV